MEKLKIDIQENALYYFKTPGQINYEYRARFSIFFEGLIEGNNVIANMEKNSKVTNGGLTFLNNYAP
jgi:hypothetical protein